MPREPMSQEGFDGAVNELKMAINNLYGVVHEQLPDGFVFDPEFDPWMATGSHWRNPRMDAVGRAINGVVEWYTYLQERLGLPPGSEPKFARHLRGEPRDE